MIPEAIRNISNPYILTPRLLFSQFVGREKEINKLRQILEEYRKSFRTRNMIITGNKSIGKSTLLNRYKQILEDHHFLVYEIELPRDSSVIISEFEFFKDLFNELFDKYAPPEGNFFSVEQSEIWYSLTSGTYEHRSSIQDRVLAFATQYANKKRGIQETLSLKQLERDFESILNQIISPDMETQGLAILVDKFQELSRNVIILDLLRQLTEKLPGLMVIGAGLPTFLENAMFEKFVRTAEATSLLPMGREDVLELIIAPLQEVGLYKKFEIQSWFDRESFTNVIERSGGNPLHVRILCSKMFDYYKMHLSSTRFELNRTVMEEVMAYYSSISEKSNRIRLALESCSEDQLRAFSLLYEYEGLSLRSTILAMLAFRPITAESEESVKGQILSALNEIWDLGLFEFKEPFSNLNEIENMSVSGLSRVEFKFVGDTIDKLYAYYLYEAMTNEELMDRQKATFEDILAHKLAAKLESVFTQEGISMSGREMLSKVALVPNEKEQHITELVQDLDSLTALVPQDLHKDPIRKKILEIARKRDLTFPAYLASAMDYKGFLAVTALTNIRGKIRLIISLFPIRDENDYPFKSKRVKDAPVLSSVLAEYMISIKSLYICWLPRQPLMYIRAVDISDLNASMVEAVSRRDFERGVGLAQSVWALGCRFQENEIMVSPEAFNNFGFCLIHTSTIAKAREVFERCTPILLISSLNLAYTWYLEKNFEEARSLLKKIVRRQLGRDHTARFMHLAIDHPLLALENRIIENVSLHNVACWNMALINAQDGKDSSMIYSCLKKTALNRAEELIDRRVKTWIAYYKGDIPKAIDQNRRLQKDCQSVSYLSTDLSIDLDIFAN
ncbi:MAG: AAA family ATPase [Parachlamydia sp.]|nr:AAA family ATPase [Parachlamydia sp.]